MQQHARRRPPSRRARAGRGFSSGRAMRARSVGRGRGRAE
jgi:hypothetical protein